MAINREAMPAALGLGGWAMSERIVPAGIADSPEAGPERWPDLDLEARQGIAAARVARWQSGKDERTSLRIAMPAGPGSERLFARIAEDLGKIGLGTSRVGFAAPADLRLVDSVARYPTAVWYYNQLSCGVLPGPCSAEADGLVAKAIAAADPAERAALFAKADSELTASNLYIPLGSPIRWSLVGGNAAGLVANTFATHPLMPMALLPK